MSSPQPLASSPADFVRDDLHALALHMHHCARARGRWFGLGSQVQRVQALAAGRIVTLACVALAVGVCMHAIA
jgi:hypothetical protein